jgi:site-specific recombinase XerC
MMAAGFPALLQHFFTHRLLQQRQASPHTIAGYRDAFRLLLRFTTKRVGRAPSALTLEDFTPTLVSDFLDHLEHVRGNGNRTRNARLAAIHAFAQYVALNEPAHALLCQRLLAIPADGLNGRSSSFSPSPKWTPCWRCPTPPPRSAVVIARCSSSHSRRDSVCRS